MRDQEHRYAIKAGTYSRNHTKINKKLITEFIHAIVIKIEFDHCTIPGHGDVKSRTCVCTL